MQEAPYAERAGTDTDRRTVLKKDSMGWIQYGGLGSNGAMVDSWDHLEIIKTIKRILFYFVLLVGAPD